MTSTSDSLMPRLAVVLASVAVAVLLLACGGHGSHGASAQRCFPASSWGPAPDRYRPCVEVVSVEEDGSFTYRVSDANGVTRYTAGIGALDR